MIRGSRLHRGSRLRRESQGRRLRRRSRGRRLRRESQGNHLSRRKFHLGRLRRSNLRCRSLISGCRASVADSYFAVELSFRTAGTVKGRSNYVVRHQTVPFRFFSAKGRSRGDPTVLAATRPSLSGFQRNRTVKGRSNYVGRHQTVPFRFFSAKGRSRGDPTTLAATRPSISGFSAQKDGQGAIQLCWSPPDRPDVISTRSSHAGF